VTPPRRLLAQESRLPAELTQALRGAPGEPSIHELEQLASQLSGALGVSLALPAIANGLKLASKGALSGTATAGVAASKPLFVLGTWVVGGLALGAGLSGVAYSVATADSPAPRIAHSAGAPSVASAAAPRAAAAEASTAPPSVELPPIVDPHSLRPLTGSPLHSAAATPSAAPAAAPESELSLLKRAQEQVVTAPAEALAIAEVHAKRFASGALAQEREVIAIDALLRLGRRSEAARRAERFQAQYPGSAHARRLSAQFEVKVP
jgi:hypothetical protein